MVNKVALIRFDSQAGEDHDGVLRLRHQRRQIVPHGHLDRPCGGPLRPDGQRPPDLRCRRPCPGDQYA